MSEAKPAEETGLCCPICRWAAQSETWCRTCGWQIRSELILGPADQDARDELARELRDRQQEYDLRCAIRASSLGTGRDEERLEKLARLARGGPPREDVRRRVTRQDAEDRPDPKQRLKSGVDFALVRMVSAQTRGITFLEVSPDGLAVQPVIADELGVPVVLSGGSAMSWADLLLSLSAADVDLRSFWLAGGVGASDPPEAGELRESLRSVACDALIELIGTAERLVAKAQEEARSGHDPGRAAPIDIVLVSRAHGWAVPDIAMRLAHRSGYPVAQLFQGPNEGSLATIARRLTDRAPLRYGYELMLVKIMSPDDRVELDSKPIFAAGDTVESRRGEIRQFELIPPPYAADVLALPVIARRGTRKEDWPRISEAWMSGTATEATMLSVELTGPGRVRMATAPDSAAEPRGARKWPELLVGRPLKLPKLDKAVDVAFLVELGGRTDRVARRVQLVRDLVKILEADAGSARAVQVAVYGYREHEWYQTSRVINRRNSLLVGRGMGPTREIRRILADEKLWEAVPVQNGRVAPLEDAVARLASERAWRPEARHVLCVIGSRPPHPPFEDRHGGLDTPCWNKIDWESLLSALKVKYRLKCLAVLDEERAADQAEGIPSGHADKAWTWFGAKGKFTAGISPQHLAQAVGIAANEAAARIGLAVDLHAHQRSNS